MSQITDQQEDVSRDVEIGQEQARRVAELYKALKAQIHKVFVGQDELVEFVLYSLLAGGHVLIEGVPGLGKTLLVRTLASTLDLPMSRIQFTPDLMPADITGTTVLTEGANGRHELRFEPGPLVASIVLADEINRATPKAQSALLEAMQEGQISVAGRTVTLPEIFVVLATQNPIEQEGTYPLPEAQLDRFLVKVLAQYPSEDDYDMILDRTTGQKVTKLDAVFGGGDLLQARETVRQVPVSRQARRYAARLTMATQPGTPLATEMVRRYVAFGASPRAAQALVLLAKVRALVGGRYAVSCEDLRAVAAPVFRHRLVLGFAGMSEQIQPDAIVADILRRVSELSA